MAPFSNRASLDLKRAISRLSELARLGASDPRCLNPASPAARPGWPPPRPARPRPPPPQGPRPRPCP
ncbi:hypothetical protein D779_2596 [Imhoffiella purpurea]|uniref:Uncharacterized protein n=1 Tax=Imhoffiella purpurea TaxID=1249627 RepID=W9VVL3_9GAMM|nr:hypothetical protein D779_2596 [Imhoffiella purpurea]